MNSEIYGDEEIEYLKTSVKELSRLTFQMESRLNRHFTIDGHLAGSIGEVFASYYYGVILSKASRKKYDGEIDGKSVQIKMTQRNSVDIKSTPDYIIVLYIRITEDEVEAYEVFNGPGIIAIGDNVDNSNGWKTISINKLARRNESVSNEQRIKQVHRIQSYMDKK